MRAEAGEGNVWDLALASQELAPYLARLSEDQRRVLEDPRRYTGIAAGEGAPGVRRVGAQVGTLTLRG